MPLTKAIATKSALQEMVAEGLALDQMAARLNIHRDSVRRALRRHKMQLHPAVPRITPAEHNRMLMLAEPGEPANWIAEDIGVNVSTVIAHVGPRPESVAEYQRVWLQILKDEDLLRLHNQIAPTSGRESFTDLRRA